MQYHLGMLSFFLIKMAHREGTNVETCLNKWTDDQLADSCAKHHGWPADIPKLKTALLYLRNALQ